MRVERAGRVFDVVRAAGECEHRGDYRRGHAGAADRRPCERRVEDFVFALLVFFRPQVGDGVVDGDAGVGVGVRGDIGDGSIRAAADFRPIRNPLLPWRSGESFAAAAAPGAVVAAFGIGVLVPDAFAFPGAVLDCQLGATDGDDVR
jgi:hypothetical protein